MKSANSKRSIRHEAQNLEVRYGEIGISAVAAAMRFQGDRKAAAQAAGEPKLHQWSRQWFQQRYDQWHEDSVPEFAA
jgi:hypothetical protein